MARFSGGLGKAIRNYVVEVKVKDRMTASGAIRGGRRSRKRRLGVDCNMSMEIVGRDRCRDKLQRCTTSMDAKDC